MHQSISNTFQFFINPERLMSSCCAVRVLIVVIDREGISEKNLFYSLKAVPSYHPA